MLIKIGEIAAQYEISNRTLRYWEEAGILTSIRKDNGYRYYDAENIKRIKQIMILRKLRLPIQDVQDIFISNELSMAVEVLQNHLSDTEMEMKQLKALSIALKQLIELVKSQQSLSEVWSVLDVPDSNTMLELKDALKTSLSERKKSIMENSNKSKLSDVRIINLPKMLFACYRVESEAPENDCWALVNKLVSENMLHEKYGFRHFGFNNPEPQPGSPVYGYEMWFVVPENFVVPEPFHKKEFAGGLFAALPTQMTVIGERWGQLWEWANENEKYEVDWNPDLDRRWLEECIDYLQFNSPDTSENDKQLDLLVPIKLKSSKYIS